MSVAVGTFDGIHLGHEALIRGAVSAARHLLIGSAVLTFDRHPLEVLDPGRAPLLLTTPGQRALRIASLGVDHMVAVRFDEAMRAMPAETFVRDILVGAMRAAVVHVGETFRFGKGRGGDLGLLRRMGCSLGFAVHSVPAVTVGGAPVSSSRIRTAVESGAVGVAWQLLGRPFALSGEVVRGDGIGRRLGYPTANLRCSERQAPPGDGVYATRVMLDDEAFAGACSIGTRPTIGGSARITEVHLLDFDRDLYGRTIEVEFIERLRGQEHYDTLDALVAQIAEDVRATRSVVGRARP
jgi:riboflavin kinase/FMN adenylyltransferase